MDDPPREATTPYLIRRLIQSSHMVNPSFYAAYSQQAEEETLNLTLEEMINKFNLSYRPPKGRRAAFPTPAGEPSDEATEKPQNQPQTADTRQRQTECQACRGRHNVKRRRNLFEELRPDGWVVNEWQERRCQEYLKTSGGKALYNEQKKHFATHPPEKPTLKSSSTKRKASQDPESPQLSATAVFLPPSSRTVNSSRSISSRKSAPAQG
jgi:hypothetical protein